MITTRVTMTTEKARELALSLLTAVEQVEAGNAYGLPGTHYFAKRVIDPEGAEIAIRVSNEEVKA